MLAMMRRPFRVTMSSSLQAINWYLPNVVGRYSTFAAILLQECSGPPTLHSKFPTDIPTVLLMPTDEKTASHSFGARPNTHDDDRIIVRNDSFIPPSPYSDVSFDVLVLAYAAPAS